VEHCAEGVWGNIVLREFGEHCAERVWGNTVLTEYGGTLCWQSLGEHCAERERFGIV